MSGAIDLIEGMFEYEDMVSSVGARVEPRHAPDGEDLQARIRALERSRLPDRTLPTHPALAPLLPGGALKEGAIYSVTGSLSLATTLMTAASAAGSWCAVVGIPEFGVEAASGAGIDLERLVLVPHPGDQWLRVTAALIDVVALVLTRPTVRGSSRLAARLRQRGVTMITLGDWPGSEASLRVSAAEWQGLEVGHGVLRRRRATVTAQWRGQAQRSTTLWLPDSTGKSAAAVTGAMPIRQVVGE